MPLRIGILIDSLVQPAWIARVMEAIQAAAFAELSVVIVDRRPVDASTSLYERLDHAAFARDDDALAPRDVGPLCDGHLLAESSDPRLRQLDLDVVVTFGPPVPRALLELPRRGAWTCRFDSREAYVRQHPTTTCAIEVDRAGERSVVAATRAGTDPISLRRSGSRIAWKAASLLLRELERAHREGAEAPATPPPIEVPLPGHSRPPLRTMTRTARRYVIQKVRDRWRHEQWMIAFRFRSGQDDPNDAFNLFHRIVPPPDRLWADPFVVENGPHAFIFVEELVYAENRGVIAVTEIHRDGSWSTPRRVLERPYHLSYPCVFRWNDSWYMVPETMDNNSVELYRSVHFPWRWEPAAVLLDNIQAVDSTIFEAGNRWWMYTTTAADGETFDELSIYHADSPLGPWVPHRRNPVLSDAVGGRCAGRPFRRDGQLLRAAQNSARHYGHAMELRRIETLTPTDWSERTIGIILPDWAPRLAGTHTLNVDGEVTVIDGMRRTWHW